VVSAFFLADAHVSLESHEPPTTHTDSDDYRR
jgi:hypothetical protein